MASQRRKTAAAVLGAAALMTSLAACGGSAPSAASHATAAPSAAPTPTQLTPFPVGYAAVDADFTPLYVGVSEGFFRRHGLDVKLNVLSGSGSAVGALLSGSVKMVVSEATPAMEAMAKGAPVVFVGSFGNTYPAEVVGETSIHSLAGLEGKTLGLEHVNSLMWSAAVEALQRAGVPLSTVRFDYLGAPPVEYAGLIAKKVNAIVNTAPYVQEAQAHGYHVIADLTTIPHVSDGLLVSKAFLAQHPKEITAFLQGLIEALTWLHSPAHAAQVKRIMGQWTHTTNPALLEDDYRYDLKLWPNNPTIPASALAYTARFVSNVTHHPITPAQAVDLTLVHRLAGFVKQQEARNGLTSGS